MKALDSYGSDDKETFHSELGEKWMRSLVQSQKALNEQETAALITLCINWLESHKDIKRRAKTLKKERIMPFDQLELANPYWLWMLPLPLIIYWFIPAYRTRQSAIKVPFFLMCWLKR